jgi:hypothetical protein
MVQIMTDLFERHNKENSDDEDHVTLKGSFEDLVDRGWSWGNLFAFLEDGKVVWTAPDCCILLGKFDEPEGHDYSIEVTCEGSSKKQSVKVTATNADLTASTLNGIFQLCSNSESTNVEITFKLFATNPRTSFPLLQEEIMKAVAKSGKVDCIRFHFVSINEATTRALTGCGIPEIEFRQCNVAGLDQALASNQGPSKMIVSCAMPEFGGFVGGLKSNTALKELDLLLHFWLQGDPFINFTNALEGNQGLERLTVSYLDISDDNFKLLVQSLRKHPTLKSVDLSFTEKFADTFRKLTPERRTQRTKTIIDMLDENTMIQDITWPTFQHDEELMPEIDARLNRNRNQAQS